MTKGIQVGRSRREALKDMAKRVGQPDLRSVAHALVQADELGVSIGAMLRIQSDQLRARRFDRAEKLAAEAGVGLPTLRDILSELQKPGRDPRDDLPKPVLRTDVLDMKDLTPGMELTGTVRNVIDFGVFVDIGVHQDGLVHISEVCDRRLRHPSEAVKVGDVVKVMVLDVDEKRKRISLTMKGVPKEA